MRPMNVTTRRGFTLAELLISLALMAVIMVAAAVALYAAESSHAYNAQKNDLVTRARGVVDRISQDVRRCSSFTVTSENSVEVTLTSGYKHAYQYSSAGGGTLLYTETDLAGVQTAPAVLSTYVQSFQVANHTPSCRMQITLKGALATSTVVATATPGKDLF
jgi:prepilin-type N-terminal cleavage/methylation domain-containing protein